MEKNKFQTQLATFVSWLCINVCRFIWYLTLWSNLFRLGVCLYSFFFKLYEV